MAMDYRWNPAGKGRMIPCSDGSEWKIGTLPNGCVVLWGHDASGRWTATCTQHGVLELGGPAPNDGAAYHAAMAHKPEPESEMAEGIRRRIKAGAR